MEVFFNITDKPFDTFEVHPCKVVDEDKHLDPKIQCIEQCEPSEAEFWSVYVHLVEGGLDCIGDFDTKGEADDFVKFLELIIKNKKI